MAASSNRLRAANTRARGRAASECERGEYQVGTRAPESADDSGRLFRKRARGGGFAGLEFDGGGGAEGRLRDWLWGENTGGATVFTAFDAVRAVSGGEAAFAAASNADEAFSAGACLGAVTAVAAERDRLARGWRSRCDTAAPITEPGVALLVSGARFVERVVAALATCHETERAECDCGQSHASVARVR